MRRTLLGLAVLIVLVSVWRWADRASLAHSPHKVYVAIGFHTNFYHSWRGDTPDEAGFGTDIRIVREIIKTLDAANAKGLDARGYWESDNLFTLGDIVPKHAPDIIEGIRRRHAAGLDEVLLAPANNGLFGAMTEEEMRASLRWAVSNPWGSGVADLFGSYTPIVRPQEYMFTTGSIPILESEGVKGVILGYSNYPFTAFSNFIAPLPPKQRYNPLWMRTEEGGPRTVVLPAVSLGDVVNFVSFEKWLIDLRKLQTRGEVDGDLLLHVNFDADAETWLPIPLPPGLRWLPNTGGLQEYIDAVNEYDWAEFTTPGEYLKTHPPIGEIVVRQDMADGGWDGNYSWAEKAASHDLWTGIESARLALRQRAALCGNSDRTGCAAGTGGDDFGGFRQRMLALSTTHFGMSTPIVNEERQAVAERIVAKTRREAEAALERAAVRSGEVEFEIGDTLYRVRVGPALAPGAAREVVSVPVVLPKALLLASALRVEDDEGETVPWYAREAVPLDGERIGVELVLLPSRASGEEGVYRVVVAPPALDTAHDLEAMQKGIDNGRVHVEAGSGRLRITLDGAPIGGDDLLAPFITYGSGEARRTETAGALTVLDAWRSEEGVQTFAVEARIRVGDGANAQLRIGFTLAADEPWVIADVDVHYPETEKRDLLHTVQQKLRRYLDLGWIEVAPFQLNPGLVGSAAQPLRVWKANYLGVVSHFDLDYGRVNPRNANLDSFNHHVTAGWVALSDRKRGLLLAQSADVLASYAFAPMRLHEENGEQRVAINPFGSYHGRQMDYSHLGGNGVGSAIAEIKGAQFRPNGPSFNGRHQRFSLLLAPYEGDAPPAEVRAVADAFFHPAAIVYEQVPPGIDARLPHQMRRLIEDGARGQARTDAPPPGAPLSFLLNPTESAVDVVWDPPLDSVVDGYEIAWRKAGVGEWSARAIENVRRHRIEQLQNGAKYEVRLRAIGPGGEGNWTATVDCAVGPVPPPPMSSEAGGLGAGVILRLLYSSLLHLLTT